VELALPNFCSDIPEPFFVNPKKGHQSYRIIESLFKAAVKFIEDQRISPNVVIALDPGM
jgi:hypothetical protein